MGDTAYIIFESLLDSSSSISKVEQTVVRYDFDDGSLSVAYDDDGFIGGATVEQRGETYTTDDPDYIMQMLVDIQSYNQTADE